MGGGRPLFSFYRLPPRQYDGGSDVEHTLHHSNVGCWNRFSAHQPPSTPHKSAPVSAKALDAESGILQRVSINPLTGKAMEASVKLARALEIAGRLGSVGVLRHRMTTPRK
jgi:hypothetical protein